MIRIKGLCKDFGDLKVLRGIDQHIRKGEKTVIIGPSGSGKSTFLRCINLLEKPTGGEIVFDGQVITDKRCNLYQVRRKMGMVFQQFNLFLHKTVLQNITLSPVHLKRMTKERAGKRAMELLDWWAGRKGGRVSGAAFRRPKAARRDRARAGDGP